MNPYYEVELAFTLPADVDPLSGWRDHLLVMLDHHAPADSRVVRYLHCHVYRRQVVFVVQLPSGRRLSALLLDGRPLVHHVTHLTGPYGRKGA